MKRQKTITFTNNTRSTRRAAARVAMLISLAAAFSLGACDETGDDESGDTAATTRAPDREAPDAENPFLSGETGTPIDYEEQDFAPLKGARDGYVSPPPPGEGDDDDEPSNDGIGDGSDGGEYYDDDDDDAYYDDDDDDDYDYGDDDDATAADDDDATGDDDDATATGDDDDDTGVCESPEWSVETTATAGSGAVGDPCSEAAACASGACLFDTQAGAASGACTAGCASDAECATGSVCVASASGNFCAPSTCGVIEATSALAVCEDLMPKELYVSADDSNSQSSPTLLRGLLLGEIYSSLSPQSIRTYEFLNYYGVSYRAPDDAALRIVAQMRPAAEEGSYKLQVGVQAKEMTRATRPNMNLVFSLDTSGSMTGMGISRIKAILGAVAAELREGDVVSIVEWNDRQSVILNGLRVKGANDDRLLDTVDSIESGGSTNFSAGLELAYALADEHYLSNGINRVLLVSDGGANSGVTDIATIASYAKGEERDAIYLIGVGAGDNYNDTLMDRVTDAGKGAAVYVDTNAEARRAFGERFIANTMVAAFDVKVRLRLPPTWDVKKFYGEQISADPREVDAQHLAPNDAMVFTQLISTCADAPNGNDVVGVDVEWRDVETGERRTATINRRLNDLLDADAWQLVKGDAIIAYAETAKAVFSATTYGNSRSFAERACRDMKDRIRGARQFVGEDDDLEEIEALGTLLCNRI